MKNQQNATGQHTPGPWRNIGKGSVVFTPAGHGWAGAEIGGMNQEANARLIASAPDLVAALVNLCSSVGPLNPDLLDREDGMDDGEWYRQMTDARRQWDQWADARAAIARAKGREQV